MTSYEALRRDVAWIDLSSRGKLRVGGEDRARLLHAMCTNHVQDLQPGDGLYAFFLSSQGRILADANIYNLGHTLLLDTEPETSSKLRDHLDRYIIADDVTIDDETAQWTTFGIEGPASLEAAKAVGLAIPQKTYCVQQWEGGFVARVAVTGPEGFRVFVANSHLEEITQKLAELGVIRASPEDVRIVRIENGRPRYGEDISERYLVQETQALYGVHANKGCYLGQEIVERVRSRGQVHRLLMPIRIATQTAPSAGTKLSINGKDVGEITSAAYSPALHETVALAYVRAEASKTGTVMSLSCGNPNETAYIPESPR